MALETKKEKLHCEEMLCKADTQKNVDLEVNLPDYCTDIKKILKCFVTPGINSHSAVGDTVKISGNVTVRLVYINEKDKVDCFESVKDFICEVKTGDIPADTCITTRVKTNYVNCRALSQRRLSISASLTVGACISAVKGCDITTDISGEGTEKKCCTQRTENVITLREKLFDMGETAALTEGIPSVEKVLYVRGYAVINSKKAVSDKMLIKGQLVTEVLYLCDTETGKTSLFRHTMPISQIIDLPGIDEKSNCSCTCEIKQLTANVKANASGENRLIEIAAKVCASVKCSDIKEVCVIEDTYSTACDLETQYALTEFRCPIYTAEKSLTHKHSLELSAEKLSEVIHVFPLEEGCEFFWKEDEALFTCGLLVGVLYRDSEGCAAYLEKNISLDITEKLPQGRESLICSPKIKIKAIDFRLAGKDRLDLSVDLDLFAEICSSESRRILCEAKPTDKKKKAPAALTLYFAEEGEELWDIAKRYSTAVKLILRENGLEDCDRTKGGMLMIPSV